ncbi:hypothetical protein BB558_003409 [Smittium angustum]|uniref:Glycosyltransferase family 15 protein n=1 Tax=Smittium angustum TaxID=133377 RepID=A0A2U1J696_SMIAN|nr:hypothetical protein BB558_003409 [Smittium angustum]
MPFTPRKTRLTLVVMFMFVIGILIYSTVPEEKNSQKIPRKNKYKDSNKPILQKEKNLKAAIVGLVRNSDMYSITESIRQLDDRFNKNFNYPIILLNDEPFTEEFKHKVQTVTKANITFGLVEGESWGYPPWVDQEKAKEERETAKYMYAKSESYRFMCRFQSGFIFNHPLLKDLDYYWRIEPDVKYFCDIEYDPFKYMRDNKLMYGWVIAFNELMDTVRTLWDKTVDFMEEFPQHIPENNFLEYVKNKRGYNGCHFWSNFEIVDLRLYRSQAYTDYFNFLDSTGGFFYERWGDAPIHSIAAAMFLRKDQIHFFEDIGYSHPGAGHCPKDSAIKGACHCNPAKNRAIQIRCARRWLKLQ